MHSIVLNVDTSHFPTASTHAPASATTGVIAFGMRSSTLAGVVRRSANPLAVVLDTRESDPVSRHAAEHHTAEVVGDGSSSYPKISRDGRYVLS
jgi:hypothetical protein